MRYRVYQDGRFASGAVASGRTLAVYDDSAMVAESTLYAAATGSTEAANPYTVPATGIIDFWVGVPRPYGLAQGDTTARPLRVMGSEHVVNVRDYGALGDGTTVDSAAIQAAVDACGTSGGVVLFPPGTYYLGAMGTIDLPPNLTGRMTLSGYSATIKLASTGTLAFNWKKNADYDVCQHYVLEGFTCDCDNQPNVGAVFCGAEDPDHLNYDDITIRDVRVTNVLNYIDDPTSHQSCINISSYHDTQSEATAGWIQNIYVLNCRMEGGDSGVICNAGLNTAGSAPYLCNINVHNIHIEGCYHDTGVRSATGFPSSNYQIGGYGAGGYAVIRDCAGYGSGDVGIEINAFRNGLVEGCYMEDAVLGFYQRNFNHPMTDGTANKQLITFRDCHYRYHTVTTDPSTGFMVGPHPTSQPLGSRVYDGCTSHFIAGSPIGSRSWLISAGSTANAMDLDSVTLRDCVSRIVGGASAGAATPLHNYFLLSGTQDGNPSSLVIDHCRFYAEATRTGTDAVVCYNVAIGGKLRFSIRDCEIISHLTDGAAYGVRLLSIGATTLAGQTVGGVVSGTRFETDALNPYNCVVGNRTYLMPTPSIMVRDCDFTDTTAASLPVRCETVADLNRLLVRHSGLAYLTAPVPDSITTKVTLNIDSVSTHATTPTVTTAAAHGMVAGDWCYIAGITELPDGYYQVLTVPLTTTFTVSGTTTGTDTGTCQPCYTNKDGYDEDVVVTGGTVTAIQLSTNAGTTWTTTGLTAGIFRLRCGDSICVTNSSAPTTTKIPRP